MAMLACTNVVAIVILALAIAQAMGARERRIAPAVITGHGRADKQCPPVEIIEHTAQNSIRSAVTTVIDSYRGNVAVPKCGDGVWHCVAYLIRVIPLNSVHLLGGNIETTLIE